jgi:sugar O-acyltransferase (sialic acid O-acetyltransferase NeuD family)
MKPLVIIGSGGYAQEVLWVVDDINNITPTWDFLGFVDPGSPEKKGQLLYDRPILGGWDDAAARLPEGVSFACGIGSPAIRRKECTVAEQQGWQPVTLVHPSVILARHVEIGPGTVVGAGSIIAPYAKVGHHCAINLHVTVGHDSTLGDFCVISPGARISGHAVLGEGVFIGTNATVYINRHMGDGASLGANSFLVTNLGAGLSAIGLPATPFGAATGAGICTTQEAQWKGKQGVKK